MNQNHITIAIDAMGGDNSPNKVIKGCEIFLKDNKNVKLIIFGDKKLIDHDFLDKYSEKISFVHCEEIILDNDDISRLNEIIGSLMIKQFNGNQKQYRAFITAIMQEYFKTNLEENK